MERFKPREPLPQKPARALVFSNNANQWTHLNAVKEACKRSGLVVDVVGSGVNAPALNPESLLFKYDLVFAKGRCAQEALAVGTAVVLCDSAGSGPLVTTGDLDRLRRLNFGIRTLSERVDVDLLEREIARYNAIDATEVSRRVRASADLDSVVDDALTLYQEVIAEFRDREMTSPKEENRAVAEYLRWMTLAARRKQAECESILANSPTLRLRNQLGRLPLVEKMLKRVARAARRNDE
jgi:hypothetical protein